MIKKILLVVIGFAMGAGFLWFLNRNDVALDNQSALLKEYVEECRQWAVMNPDDDDMVLGASATTREYKSAYSVIYAGRKYLSFRAEEYSYTGGAHGSNKITVATIDRKTGKMVRLADFISADEMPVLKKLLLEKVIKKLGGKVGLQGEVRPVENFCVVKDGLMFVYNEYEVACYAAGAIEVVVSFDEIKGSR